MNRTILAILMVAFTSAPASAGVIALKNGDKITGTIKRVWDGEVYIEPEYADEFSVDQDAIAWIEDDRPMEIENAQGEDIIASLAGADENGNQIIIVDGVSVAVPLASLEEIDEPEKYSDWEIRADLKTSFDSGNTDSQEINFSGEGMYKVGRQKHIVDWLNSNEENEDVTTKDRNLYRYTFNYEVADPWFAGASGYYERDPIKGLDYRYSLVPTAGYNVWDDAEATLNFSAGAGYQAEKTFEEDEFGAKIREEDDGAVALFLLRFRYDFGDPDLELYATNSTAKAFYGRENMVTQFVTGMRYEITDLLYTTLELNVDYETEPPEGNENEDVSILFGFGVEFDK